MRERWTTEDLPVGFYELHPDPALNFQLNRLDNLSNDADMLAQIRNAASSFTSYADVVERFTSLGHDALADREALRAALYFRGAELTEVELLAHAAGRLFQQMIAVAEDKRLRCAADATAARMHHEQRVRPELDLAGDVGVRVRNRRSEVRIVSGA